MVIVLTKFASCAETLKMFWHAFGDPSTAQKTFTRVRSGNILESIQENDYPDCFED